VRLVPIADGGSVRWTPLARVRGAYRGRQYLDRFTMERRPYELRRFATWVCRSWNDTRAGGARALASIQVPGKDRPILLGGARRAVGTEVLYGGRCPGGEAGRTGRPAPGCPAFRGLRAKKPQTARRTP
jgi:hypothetical protein